MKKILFSFLLIAVLALASCVLPKKVEIFFNNYSSYSVDFYMNGTPILTNPVSSNHWTEWAGLNAGDYILSAVVPNQYTAAVGVIYTPQNMATTGTFYLGPNELFTFNVYNGLTWTGSVAYY